MNAITETGFMPIPIFKKGKVRDIYQVGDELLIISTDRISAFDVIMNEGIPGKGKVLNSLAAFWFSMTSDIIRNHLITVDMEALPSSLGEFRRSLEGRSMLVKKAEPLSVECIVRGYLAGSGWSEYRGKGSVSGIVLPQGLKQADKLPEPIFTPSTKAEIGLHDENISMEIVRREIGDEAADVIEKKSLELYQRGSEIAESKGIILADTKFEFGILDGEIILIDEIFTPDSSRFWPRDRYEPGHEQENLDKQFLRDWLESLKWDKKPPPPTLPEETIHQTAERYEYISSILLKE